MRRLGLAFLLLCVLWPCAAWAEMTLLVDSYAFGPGVAGLVLELEAPAEQVSAAELKITCLGVERTCETLTLCDAQGQPVEGPAGHVLLTLSEQGLIRCPLFGVNLTTGQKNWMDSYEVTVSGHLTADGKEIPLALSEDCAGRRICPDSDQFSVRMAYTGQGWNSLTGEAETQTIRLAAFEPETLRGGSPNPLIIWLHGAGEGGTEIEVALLGNEVTLLAGEGIQRHFTSEDGSVGAYVLIPQCETCWMDEGDGKNGDGTGGSRYTEVLMAAITDYIASRPDIDSRRIYLGGCSNGGYMTMNLLAEYPGFFAAAFPTCEAYDTSERYDQLDTLLSQPIWFIQSADDWVVDPDRYVLPTYTDLIFGEAEDCWLSMFDGFNHAVWTAVFHDLVNGVQNAEEVYERMAARPDREKGGEYTANGTSNLFDWLNAHTLNDPAAD